MRTEPNQLQERGKFSLDLRRPQDHEQGNISSQPISSVFMPVVKTRIQQTNHQLMFKQTQSQRFASPTESTTVKPGCSGLKGGAPAAVSESVFNCVHPWLRNKTESGGVIRGGGQLEDFVLTIIKVTPFGVCEPPHPDLLPSGRGEGDGTRASVVDHGLES